MPAVWNPPFQSASADLGLPGQKCRNDVSGQEHRDGDVTPTRAPGSFVANPSPRQLALKPLEANVGATSRRDHHSHRGTWILSGKPFALAGHIKATRSQCGSNVPSRSSLPQVHHVPPQQTHCPRRSHQSHSKPMWEQRPVAIITPTAALDSLAANPLPSKVTSKPFEANVGATSRRDCDQHNHSKPSLNRPPLRSR
jgi:hypothetical protein